MIFPFSASFCIIYKFLSVFKKEKEKDKEKEQEAKHWKKTHRYVFESFCGSNFACLTLLLRNRHQHYRDHI